MKRFAVLSLIVLAGCGQKEAAPPEPAAPAAAPAQTPAPAPAAAKAPEEMAMVTWPLAGMRMTSPLRVEGTAPGPWFFEAVVPVTLVVNGQVIAEAPGQAQRDWMTTQRVPFLAEVAFTVTAETEAELVVAQDMPGFDDDGNELPALEVRIPLLLAPAGAP